MNPFPGAREQVRSFAYIRRIYAFFLSSPAIEMQAFLCPCLPVRPVNSPHYFSDIVFVCSFQGTNGDGEIRTHDPLLARQVLSQLSYTPICVGAHLLSHTVSSIVSSAAQVLTIVFGMGTGVTPGRISTNNFESLMTQQ